MKCPVCGTENPETVTVCRSCRSFIQNRVPTLDLFRTVWGLVEAPLKTLRMIALSEHKNYAVLLYALAGIPCGFMALVLLRAGALHESLPEMLAIGYVAGAVAGVVSLPILTGSHALLSRVFKGEGGWSRSLGTTAYALSPVAMIGVFLVPIYLLTFGIYGFTGNPHPLTINPVAFIGQSVLLGSAALWAGVLLVAGTKLGHRLSGGAAVVVSIAALAVVLAAWIGGMKGLGALLAGAM